MITFYNDCTIYGGTEQLTVTLARELRLLSVPFKAILPRSGKQWELISPLIRPDLLYDFDELDMKNPQQVIAEDDVLLVHCAAQAARLNKVNPRILYWCVSPEMIRKKRNFLIRILASPLEWIFIRHLLSREALYFLDDTSVRGIRRWLGLHIKNPSYLPVPVAADEHNRYTKRTGVSEAGIILTYLGRAEDWKVYPCAAFLKQVRNYTKVKSVHIVTDHAGRFRDYMAEQGVDLESVVYHEGLYGEALRDFLRTTSDLHFAMGTSALDAAGLGIPTILIDAFSDPAMGSYATYRWVSEIKNFTLGEFLTPHHRNVPGRSLEQLLGEFNRDRMAISEQCRNYVLQHHAPVAVCRQFMDATDRSRARVQCLRWFDFIDKIKTRLFGLVRKAGVA